MDTISITEVVGSKATLRIGYLRQTALTVLTSDGASHDVVNHFLVRFAEAYLNELHDFVDCVLAGSPPKGTCKDARKAIAMALAAQYSYRESRPSWYPTKQKRKLWARPLELLRDGRVSSERLCHIDSARSVLQVEGTR